MKKMFFSSIKCIFSGKKTIFSSKGKLKLLFSLILNDKKSRLILLISLVLGVLSAVFNILLPLIIGSSIDTMLKADASLFLSSIKRIIAVLFLFAASSFGFSCLMNELSYRAVFDLRNSLYKKLNSMKISRLDKFNAGEISARLTQDSDQVLNGLVVGLPRLVNGLVSIVGVIAVLFYLNALSALVVLVLTPLSIIVAKKITLASHVHFMNQAKELGNLSAFASEHIKNMDMLKLSSYSEKSKASFEKINENYRKAGFKAQIYASFVNPLTRFVNHGVYIAVGLTGGLVALYSGLSIGGISAVLSYANKYTLPFNEISSVIHQLQLASVSLSRLECFLNEENEEGGAAFIESEKGDISFENVGFSYQEGVKIIDDLNIDIRSGEKLAIVGKTGAGKTSLINLILRFYDCSSGRILLDSRDIRDLELSCLRKAFSMVLQDSWVFSGTILDNIAIGAKNASLDEVKNAARLAHADGFIARLSKGYQSVIEESLNLSKGQVQLICLARLLLSKAPILILDEATSAVDTRTEAFVSEALDKFSRGRTSIVIAHRLSTIKNADRIILLDNGRLVEMGRHEELLNKKGAYYRLYKSQFE